MLRAYSLRDDAKHALVTLSALGRTERTNRIKRPVEFGPVLIPKDRTALVHGNRLHGRSTISSYRRWRVRKVDIRGNLLTRKAGQTSGMTDYLGSQGMRREESRQNVNARRIRAATEDAD